MEDINPVFDIVVGGVATTTGSATDTVGAADELTMETGD